MAGDWDRPCSDCKRRPKDDPSRTYPVHTTNGREYRGTYCHPCIATRERQRKHTSHQHNVRNRENQYMWRYGETFDQLTKRLGDQDGKCAICRKEIYFGFHVPLEPGKTKRNSTARVDHCHKHGKKIRGILCASCNNGIGYLKDDPSMVRLALEYLENFENEDS